MIFTLGRCGPAIFAAACLASATAQDSRPAGPPAPVLPGAPAPAPGSPAPSAPVGGATSRPAFATAVFLSDWDRWRHRFWQVCPKEMLTRLAQPLNDTAVLEAAE